MSFGLLQHLEIPYSKTPFDKNTLLEEYKNDFDSVTIQCKVNLYFSQLVNCFQQKYFHFRVITA